LPNTSCCSWYLVCLLVALGCGGDDPGGSDGTAEQPEAAGSTTGWGEDLVVDLADGALQGDLAGNSVRFLKIPYAAPPIGALRWKAPIKNQPWKGTRHEQTFASACAQQMSSQGGASENEDCLYLNVWAPKPRPSKAPVMVWIHGGGNFAGSAADKVPDPLASGELPLFYDGRTFAERQGVVLVTLNYRLGPFGFFSHPALAADGSPRGNQGLLDQKRALEWVHDNIAAFGGDPANVTVFGESAGSSDVCYHVVSPLSRGLFHKAISESGGCTVSPRGTGDTTAEQTADQMRAFARALGCASDADALTCLRSKTTGEILAQAMQPNPSSGGYFFKADWSFSVVVDGAGGFVPEPPRALLERGDFAKVPYLLGSNNDEGSLFTLTTVIGSEAEYRALLAQGYGKNADRVFAQYPPSAFNGDFRAAYSRLLGDSSLVCGTHDVARRVASAGAKVFMYNFNVTWAVGFGTLGAAHGAEIGHVFGTPYMPSEGSTRVAEAMNRYWASFARTGDPNFTGAPQTWPSFQADSDRRLSLDESFSVLSDFRADACAFWSTLYDEAAAAP